MTNEEKIKNLERAEERGYMLLNLVDPSSESYSTLLDNLSATRLFIECLKDGESFKPHPCTCTSTTPETDIAEPEKTTRPAVKVEIPEAAVKQEEPEATLTPVKAEEPVEQAEPEATPEPVKETQTTPLVTTDDPKPIPGYSKADLLDLLKKARRSGVNVTEIIHAFGVTNFGDIDEAKYPEVVEMLRKEGSI